MTTSCPWFYFEEFDTTTERSGNAWYANFRRIFPRYPLGKHHHPHDFSPISDPPDFEGLIGSMVGLHNPVKQSLLSTCPLSVYMGVSLNGCIPKSSILIGFSIINHPFWGTPIFWKHPYVDPFWYPSDEKKKVVWVPLTAFQYHPWTFSWSKTSVAGCPGKEVWIQRAWKPQIYKPFRSKYRWNN